MIRLGGELSARSLQRDVDPFDAIDYLDDSDFLVRSNRILSGAR